MSGRTAESRLEVLQLFRIIKCLHDRDKEYLERMVKTGVENLINLTVPEDGSGLLHIAVSHNYQDMVSCLLSHGANPDIQDKRGRTAVMVAARVGNDVLVELLSQGRADMTLQDTEGKGVLFYCMQPTKCHMRCLKMALDFNADANNMSAQGIHVFQAMCENAQEFIPMCVMMLDNGANPNATAQTTGVTVLMEAAKVGCLQLVRALLKKGGDPNATDKKRRTAVHYAAMGGFFEVIRVLSAHSADMAVIDMDLCTALHYAAASADALCCRFLAQRGCSPKLKNREGFLPLQIAKDAGHKDAAAELKKADKKPGKGQKSTNVCELWARTLHDWSHENEAELREALGDTSATVTADQFISVLEDLNAPVNRDQLQTVVSAHAKDKPGCVNVTEFIEGTKYITQQFLLSSYGPKKKKGEKGAKGGKKKKSGKSVVPLPICTLPPERLSRRPDGGRPHYMIERFCSDFDGFDGDHPPEHPLMDDSAWYRDKPDKVYVNINSCVKSGDLESLELAFSQGVPVDVQDPYYNTPLNEACSIGNYEVAQYLLSKGANVHQCDQFFWTPLHHAADAGQVELVELMIEAGAIVDSPSIGGYTPLMGAIQSSRPSCVDVLIDAGANVYAKTKSGENCLDIAMVFADSRIVDMVKDRMKSLPRPKETKTKEKPQPAKVKSVAVVVQAETSTVTVGKTSPQSVILQNSIITAGRANAVDRTFVPKTVWGKPPTTRQLMAKVERRKELLPFDMDDLMMPLSRNVQRKILEMANKTD